MSLASPTLVEGSTPKQGACQSKKRGNRHHSYFIDERELLLRVDTHVDIGLSYTRVVRKKVSISDVLCFNGTLGNNFIGIRLLSGPGKMDVKRPSDPYTP